MTRFLLGLGAVIWLGGTMLLVALGGLALFLALIIVL